MKKVSIITVCLNSVNTIEQTICSVLNQTYKNIEYIIIDGGSTDGTQDIINKYINYLSYYCSEKDYGIYNAMNKGIQHARGEIIGIINSDDWYAPNTVELAVSAMKNNMYQMVHGDLEMIYPNNVLILQKARNMEDLYMAMTINHPTVFALRELYQKFGEFDEDYKSASDYELMLRWHTNGVKTKYIPKVFAYFRKGGYSNNDYETNAEETYKISKKYIEEYITVNKDNYLKVIKEIRERNKVNGLIRNRLWNLNNEEKVLFKNKISKLKEVVIFGTGSYSLWAYEILMMLGIKIFAWVDNDKEKQGKTILGLTVLPVEKINPKNQQIIIGTKSYAQVIVQQLNNMEIFDDSYILLSEIEELILKS